MEPRPTRPSPSKSASEVPGGGRGTWLAHRLPTLGLATLLALPIVSIVLELVRYPVREIALNDHALLELDTLYASRGELLLGAYSRYGWHHPGPAPFYLAAPFYALGGHTSTSLNVFAGGWSWAALAIAATAWFRATRRPALRWAFVLAMASILVSMALGFPQPVFTDTWNPALALLPFWALLVVSTLTIAGRRRWLPVAVLLHALAAQAHVGTVLPATSALLLAAGTVWWRGRKSPRAVGRVALTSVTIAAVSWGPVLWEALAHRGGNLAQIVRWTLEADEPRDPERWSLAVRTFTRFASEGLVLHGGEDGALVTCGLLLTGVIGGLVVVRMRRPPRHPLTRAALLSTEVQMAVAVVNVALMRGPALVWLVLWLIPICGLACVALLCALAEEAPRPAMRGPILQIVGLVSSLVLGGLVCHHELSCPPFTEPATIRRATVAVTCLLRETAISRPHLALYGANAWREGAGLTLGLAREGIVPVLVPGERYRFGETVAYERTPDVWFRPTLAIASEPYCRAPLARFGDRCLTAAFLLNPTEPWARAHLDEGWSFESGRAAIPRDATATARVPLFPSLVYDLRLRGRALEEGASLAVAFDGRQAGIIAVSDAERDFDLELPSSSSEAPHTLSLRATDGGIEVAELELTPRLPARCLD